MDANVRAYFSELVGTFFYVFLGAGAVCCTALTAEPRLGVTAVALAEGATLAVLLSLTAPRFTGYYNPAVTIALWVFKRLEGVQMLGLIAVQVLGAGLAGLCVLQIFSPEVLRETHLGAPHLKAFVADGGVTWRALASGVAVEALFTCLLTMVLFATLVYQRAPHFAGLGAGLAQLAIVVVGFRLTGGAANPARWFGPAIWQLTVSPTGAGVLADHPVYWVGPILGALLGGLLAATVLLPPKR
jgi:aquaporin TIP